MTGPPIQRGAAAHGALAWAAATPPGVWFRARDARTSAAVRAAVASHATSYVIAIVVVATAVAVKAVAAGVSGDHPFLLFAAAIAVATARGGRGPGVLATAVAALASDILFLPPIGVGSSPPDLYALALLVGEGLLIVVVTASLRDAADRAVSVCAEVDRERRAAFFALQARDELLRLWTRKLGGPLADVRLASEQARSAMESEDREALITCLAQLEADTQLLLRTADASMSDEWSRDG